MSLFRGIPTLCLASLSITASKLTFSYTELLHEYNLQRSRLLGSMCGVYAICESSDIPVAPQGHRLHFFCSAQTHKASEDALTNISRP